MLHLTVYSVPKTRLGDIYLLQTLVVNLHYTVRDRGLGGLVPPANFEASFCFSSACLATRYIWSPQFLSLLRVLWCELAFFLLGFLPVRRMEKHLAEWRKMKPKIVATCHPLSIFEKCNICRICSPVLLRSSFHFYSFTLISGKVQEDRGSFPHVELEDLYCPFHFASLTKLLVYYEAQSSVLWLNRYTV